MIHGLIHYWMRGKMMNADIEKMTTALRTMFDFGHISTEDALYALSVYHALGNGERLEWWKQAQDAIDADDECLDGMLDALIVNHQVYYNGKACPIVVQQMYDRIVSIRDARRAAIAPVRIRPCEVHWDFMGSSWRKSEMESMMGNILFVCNAIDANNWQPFSWDDYCGHMQDTVSDKERAVLDALVDGGSVWLGGSYSIPGGWLSYDALTEQYAVTDKLISWYEQYRKEVKP